MLRSVGENAGERTTGNRYRFDWVAYTREVLVCWQVQARPDGSTGRQMVRLMVLGEVDHANIRAVPLRLIATADPDDYPRWSSPETAYPDITDDVPPPPSARQIIDAWASHRPVERPEVKVGPRTADESADDFYRRVADAYRMFAASDGRPTTMLAGSFGVSKNLAAQWVHQARVRGHLEQTTRGRAGR